MSGQRLVWMFFASLLGPVIGMASCWSTWVRRRYRDLRRRRIVQVGLALGSVAVLFAAVLPLAAMLPLHMRGRTGETMTELGMMAGVAAPPVAAVLLGFGYGMERWLGIACVVLALLADLAMLVGVSG